MHASLSHFKYVIEAPPQVTVKWALAILIMRILERMGAHFTVITGGASITYLKRDDETCFLSYQTLLFHAKCSYSLGLPRVSVSKKIRAVRPYDCSKNRMP